MARVDVLCLDKTGTITEGQMEVVGEENFSKKDLGGIISFICSETKDQNPTAIALRKKYTESISEKAKKVLPFTSKNKYSGVILENDITYLVGAPEFILDAELQEKYRKKITDYSQKYRLLVLVEKEKDKSEVLGFVFLQDKIRENARKTLEYFKRQGVSLKIISGDHPLTVKNIAERAGLSHLKEIDATCLKDEENIIEAVEKYNIFGRVTPEQKKDLVIALQNLGHIVAMTGDGVNDVLALKEADCSIAMASGSDATKNVSQLVLLDSDFSSMPYIVKEGRRTINNIERSASLFLVKTVYASILAVLFIFIDQPYPFIPIQLTLASISTIGIPSFILSFEPNNEIVKGAFLTNVLKRAVPPAFIIVFNIIVITILNLLFHMTYEQASTLSVFMTGMVMFMLLCKICKPLNKLRTSLIVSMFTIFILGFVGMRNVFSFSKFNTPMAFIVLTLTLLSYYFYHFFEVKFQVFLRKIDKNKEKRKKNLLKKQENT